MQRQLFIWLIGLFLFGGTLRCSAQEGTVFKYTLDDVPQHLIVVKGAILEFSGDLESNAPVMGMSLRSRNIFRDQGRFTDHWTLRWDSGKEPFTATSLSVWQDVANVPVQRIRIYVRIVDAPLFRFATPAPSTRVFGPLAVKLETVGTEKAEKFVLTVDGKPTQDRVSDMGAATWNTEGLALGEHTLGAFAVMPDDYRYALAPVPISLLGPVMQTPLVTGDQVDTAYLNGNIPLHAILAPDIAVSKVSFYIDAGVVAERTAPPYDTATWNPATVPTGPHVYRVEVIDTENHHFASPGYHFTVQNRTVHRRTTEEERPPLEKPKPAAGSDALDSPTDTGDDQVVCYPLTSLPPAISLTSDMRLQITGYLDTLDSPMIALQDHDVQLLDRWDRRGDYILTVDASKLDPGVHPIRVIYPVPGGSARVLAQCTVTVYQTDPVQLIVPKEPKDLFHLVTLAVKPIPGFKVQSVTYYKDDRPLTPCPDAPLTAVWDARRERPGDCLLWAVVAASDGSIFKTHAKQVHIPVRVSVAGPKDTLALTEDVKRLPVLATIADDLTPVTVEYILDGELVATRKSVPFDRITLDADGVLPGVHKVVVRVLDAGGAEYISEPRVFGTTFTEDEAAQVQVAVEKRVHLEELARLRRRDLDKIRDRIAAVGEELYKPVRKGKVGHVNGLRVNTYTRYDNEGHSELAAAWGQVIPIEATWKRGAGHVKLNVDQRGVATGHHRLRSGL